MRTQTYIYVTLNLWLFHEVKKYYYDKEDDHRDSLVFIIKIWAFYVYFGAFVPILQAMWLNRTWCFKCVPRFSLNDLFFKKKVDTAQSIHKEIRYVELLAKEVE
jgi:hypothetical protein